MATMVNTGGGGSGGGLEMKRMTDSSLDSYMNNYSEVWYWVDCMDDDVDIFNVPIKNKRKLLVKTNSGSYDYLLLDFDKEKALKRTIGFTTGWDANYVYVRVDNGVLHLASSTNTRYTSDGGSNTITIKHEDGTTKGPFTFSHTGPSTLNTIAIGTLNHYDPSTDKLYVVVSWGYTFNNAPAYTTVHVITNVFSNDASVISMLDMFKTEANGRSAYYQYGVPAPSIVGSYKRNGKICFRYDVPYWGGSQALNGCSLSIDTSTNQVLYNYDNNATNALRGLLYMGYSNQLPGLEALDVYKGQQVVFTMIGNIRKMIYLIPVTAINTDPITGVAYSCSSSGAIKDALYYIDEHSADILLNTNSTLPQLSYCDASHHWLYSHSYGNTKFTWPVNPIK